MKTEIKYNGNFAEIPCLAGHDVNRETGTIVLARTDPPTWAEDGSTVLVEEGGELIGWGELDGPSMRLSADGCPWFVNVPVAIWERFLSHRQ